MRRQLRNRSTPLNQQQNPDWRQGYGFQFWISRFGYRGDGAFGQFCVILPEYDAVLATTACTLDMQAILDAAWTHLLPGLRDGTAEGGSAQTELASRLRTLALPACQAAPEPRNWSGWESQEFSVGYRDSVPEAERTIASVRVERAGAEVRVTLTEAANALSFVIGTNTWSVSSPADQFGKPIPVASSGGWTDNNRFHVEVIFLETPHRMDIDCSLEDGCASATWRLPPLGDCSLSVLRNPI